MRIVLLGAPGSGKGTQAKLLMDKHDIPQVSTGDLLREALSSGSELGKAAKTAMDAGRLVSDEIVLGIIRERLRKPDAENGFILDGYPRNLSQAKALTDVLSTLGKPLDHVVLINVANEVLMKRLTGRRTCETCGSVYNIYTSPPSSEACDNCGGKLLQRADDNEDTIANRLKVYDSQTKPLIKHYSQQGKLLDLDADDTVENVFTRLEEVLS